jgi:hypothetical protein
MEPTEITLSPAPELQPTRLFAPNPRAARRVLEFFTAQINNDHTRRAYLNATRRFADWCDAQGEATLGRPSNALRLARHRLGSRSQPGHAVRGPSTSSRKGRRPYSTSTKRAPCSTASPSSFKPPIRTARSASRADLCHFGSYLRMTLETGTPASINTRVRILSS